MGNTLSQKRQSSQFFKKKSGQISYQAQKSNQNGNKSDSDSEKSDGSQELLEPTKPYRMRGPRVSVSAEAYGKWNKKEAFIPPVYPKTDEEKESIKKSLSQSFLFSTLDEDDFLTVLNAILGVSYKKGDAIITQGDDGDRLYVIQEGTVECTKADVESSDKKIHLIDLGHGDAFGELALLYNCPRAASVTALSDTKCWSLDRETFSHIVKDAASRRISMYEDFLKDVELLKEMDPYERNKLTMALRSDTFPAESKVIKQGENGDAFYLVISGEAKAVKDGKEVMLYRRGDYFGELALLKDQPRAADIIAKTKLRVAYLDRAAFRRLLGPVEDILKRNTKRYSQVIKQIE